MSSLRRKAVSGASWSLTGRVLQQGVQFIIGIILARLLAPAEYGLIAMAGVFIYVSYVFVDSGFSTALIQKKECSSRDLSTVFLMNLFVSLVAWAGFFLLAPMIASFYGEPQLVGIIRVLSLIIVLYALSLVQNAIIRRDVNFKLQTRIELVAQLLSGAIAIYLAWSGYGVWSLVWKTLLNQVFINIQLWIGRKWKPSFRFSKESFKELFAFSSKLLASGLLDRIYQQLHRLVVGKFFPSEELGYYTRAEQFNNLPSHTLSGTLINFLLPVLSKMQADTERMKNAVRRVLKMVMVFNINGIMLMGILAGPVIELLLGEKWSGAVPYLQLLVVVGLFYPMHAINVQIITSLGRSDIFLKVEIIKKIIGVPAILLGVFIGIKAMIVGMIVTSFMSLAVNTYYTKRFINYGLIDQIKSLTNSFKIAGVLAVVYLPLRLFVTESVGNLATVLFISISAIPLIILISKALRMEEYMELKRIVFDLRNQYGNKG